MMGMDVEGLNPPGVCVHLEKQPHRHFELDGCHTWCDGAPGAYFRNNWWWWRPLWDFCHLVAPDIISDELYAVCHSNSGLGLNAKESEELAERLFASLDGMAQKYERSYKEQMELIDDEICYLCNGTGQRNDDIGKQMRQDNQDFTCNGCKGNGKRRPMSTWYPFDCENVQAFARFLRSCGGFECW